MNSKPSSTDTPTPQILLACAVALANLDLYKKENLLENVRARSRQLRAGLASLRNHSHVKEIRQIGLMVGIDLVQRKHPMQPYPPAARMGLRVCEACIERGLWLRPLGDTVVLMPPLAITEKELGFLIHAVTDAIDSTTSSGVPERRGSRAAGLQRGSER